ncbi:MAG: phosphatase domain-containing putative toxin, partial [Gallionella sp.]
LGLIGFGVAFGKRVVLDGITLSLSPVGIDVLMGPVKSGKSTLLRSLAGLYQNHALQRSWGQVQMNDINLDVAHRPLLMQQHAQAFEYTMLQALLEPLRQTQQKSPAEWRQLGLLKLTEHGLTHIIAQADQPLLQCALPIQRSVLVLAQALCQPTLLLLDEPTYGLNDNDALWLIDWLKTLGTRCKLWVALHNQIQAKRLADSIVLIGGGHLLAHQSCGDFFARPANDLVAQFIRTGSLSLPSPDVQAAHLADGSTTPQPLSAAAQATILEYQNDTPVLTKVSKLATSSLLNEPPLPANQHEHLASIDTNSPPALEPRPSMEWRAPVALPASSRDGVELASSIGEVTFRDNSAPRGFHWIVPGKLAGCPAPGVSAPIDYDLKLLAKTGITKLITLTETDLDQAVLRCHGLSNLHMPIFDREAPSVGQTHMLLVRMQRMIDAGEVLAVHCKAGLGRTGTILAAWMIREGGLSATNAMERLRRIEPGFIQSASQENFLHEYEADLTNRLI